MKRVVIFGTGQFAELMLYYLKSDNKYEVCGFTVDAQFMKGDNFCGLPVVEFERTTQSYPPSEYGMFICTGYTKMNTVREQKFNEAKKMGYRIMDFTHQSSVVLSHDFGEGNIILENVTVGPMSKIGDGNIFFSGSHIAHHTIVHNFNFFAISCAVAGNVTIHNNCFLGNNCTIKDGVCIKDYTLVGAGCYLSRDSEKNQVYTPQASIKLNKDSLDIKL